MDDPRFGVGIEFAPARSTALAVPERAPSLVTAAKAAKSKAPYAVAVRNLYGDSTGGSRPRAARMLRHFAKRNVFVRIAIERRKQQISQAKWHLVRLDDPKKPPDPGVVKRVADLFRFVNTKRESSRSLLDMVMEDLLVLDAGCIEKEKTLGGEIFALWAVDGSTIAPDANWDGRNQKAIRYRQFIDQIKMADFRNDELIYMMTNPSTSSPVGWSKVETLIQIIEAELYGEDYDYDQLRQTAPAGMLDLGPGVPDEKIEGFRDYYEGEIAGEKGVAIFGGGDDPGRRATWIPWTFTSKELERNEYRKWLAGKIAAVFQMDLGVFNLTQAIHRSIGEVQQQKTDEGHVALANLVAEYISREIIWEIDENHGFEFSDLNARDAKSQGEIDKINMAIGVTTPNLIRAREGEDPFPGSDNNPEHWANLPYPFNNNTAATPAEEPFEAAQQATEVDDESETDDEQSGDDRHGGAGKDASPFAAARARMRSARNGYLIT